MYFSCASLLIIFLKLFTCDNGIKEQSIKNANKYIMKKTNCYKVEPSFYFMFPDF